MNREHIIKYIRNPHQIDDDATTELEKVLQQYPYFQTAHLLFVKGLKNNNSIRFHDQLKIAATYAGNRTFLFNLLNTEQSDFSYAPETLTENEEAKNQITDVSPISSIETDSISQTFENQKTSESVIQTPDSAPETAADSIPVFKSQIPEHKVSHKTISEPNTPREKSENIEFEGAKTQEQEEQIPFIDKLQESSEPEIVSTVLPIDETNKELHQEPTSETKESPEPEKPEQSLADIILQRLKEIEERDSQKASEQILENIQPDNETNFHNELTTIPTPSELELPESENPILTTQEQFVDSSIKPSDSDDLLDFAFHDISETDTQTQKPEEITSPPEPKTIVHASSMWFEKTEIPRESLDISNPIDAFLAKQPQMKPHLNIHETSQDSHDISEESVKEGEYLSETLAKIYVAQKNYTKAIQIYQKLSLKYPQKSVYFANQILEIQENLK